ncbi:hypothetical protein PCASD_22594 [Puccinia coronata f. sp. avenae]|uniref:Uncharacterized protein n=1 Tax=Puccinia coronata f. sp. avenae TaxID=200324 RepID=A0A2N5S465_9BASI|nr:hypothetical protein PCASD_22594 [Puccinia coronata f. sp. avenae]
MLAPFWTTFFMLFCAFLNPSTEGISLHARDGEPGPSPTPPPANLGGTSAIELEFSTVVQGWSAIPWAFSKCRSTFEQRPPPQGAIEAINTLASSTKIVVSQHSSCNSCRSLGTQSTYYVEFEQIIRQIFVSWQSVLLDGAQKYPQQWKPLVGVVFKTFTSFLVTIYDICLSLHIDLTIIFRSINLNYQLFLDVGLNLAEILKLNGGTAHVGQLPQGPQGSVQSATNAIKPQTHSTNLINNSQGTGSGGMGVNNGSIQSSAQDPSSILEAWNSVPIAFGKCRAVFQKKVSSSEALQAVSTLHATIQSFVSRYGACKPCDSMNHQDAFSAQFQAGLRATLIAWQSILLLGEQQYKAEWNVAFKAAFAQFDQFLVALKDMSMAIKFDLRALLVKIHLNPEIFLSAGLNVFSRLDIPQVSIGGKLNLDGGATPMSGALTPPSVPATTVPGGGTGDKSLLATGTSSPGGMKPDPSGNKTASGGTTPLSGGETSSIGGGVSSSGGVASPSGLAQPSSANGIPRSGANGIPGSDGGHQAVGTVTSPTGRLPPFDGGRTLNLSGQHQAPAAVISPTEPVSPASPGEITDPKVIKPPAVAATPALNLEAGSHAHGNVHSASLLPGRDMSALVSGWSALPNAFNKCQLALESHPPINVALQAIFSLQVTVQLTISTYGSCTTCSTLSPNSELALRFKTIITQIFTSWQNFVHLGQNNYGSQWQISTDAVFKKFGTFLIAVKRICSAIKINLGALFGEMRLDANFFPKIGFHAGSPFDLILGNPFDLNLGGQIGGAFHFSDLIPGLFQ